MDRRDRNACEVVLFVDDYEDARSEPFTQAERRAALAAATYHRAYSTRCGHALGAARTEALREYADAFL